MKHKLTLTAIVFLLSCLLALPALGAKNGNPGPGKGQAKGQLKGQVKQESEGRKLHKAYFEKREAMKKRRDDSGQLRQQLLQSDNPGNTGF